MLFNSIDFAIFLPLVFILYWLLARYHIRWQNILIVVASYVFYGWWDYRFLLLILVSSSIDYLVGKALAKCNEKNYRKWLLIISIISNLGLLGFFKYYNFFLENFVAAFSFFNFTINAQSLAIILPVGISFYTFQTLSYTIDIYKKKMPATSNFITFAAFVSFFPQLVAGPIERASNLLPQFTKKRYFDYSVAVDGLRQMLWGLFKKIAVADSAAQIANEVFNNSSAYTGIMLLLGAVFFSIQIYGDFSGYSDIAIGVSKLFGFTLKQNFAYPYFSRDIAEFWRRWHISLSTWFRDYLYIPLGGSKGNLRCSIRNVFVIFIVSGFWHGATWNFIIWGILNALFFLPLLLLKKNRVYLNSVAEGHFLPSLRETGGMIMTFSMITFAFIFFRTENIAEALAYCRGIFIQPFFSLSQILEIYTLSILIFPLFFLVEWLGRNSAYPMANLSNYCSKSIRYVIYYGLILAIFYFSSSKQEFIYFQF